MAIQQKDEKFVKWMHIENGNHMVRRIHEMQLVMKGKTYVLDGDQLPDVMVTNCGESHKGRHVAQLILNPQKRTYIPDVAQPWPLGRDVIHLGLGFVGFVMFRFFLFLLIEM